MKTRQGFVSNSSSSSFVVLGFVIDSDDDRYDEDAEGIWDDGTRIIGKVLADGDGYDFDNSTTSVQELMLQAQQIAADYGVPLKDIMLHTGTRAC